MSWCWPTNSPQAGVTARQSLCILLDVFVPDTPRRCVLLQGFFRLSPFSLQALASKARIKSWLRLCLQSLASGLAARVFLDAKVTPGKCAV